MGIIYNFLLFLYLIFLFPKIIFDYLFFNKKKDNLLYKLGIKKYHFDIKDKDVIWIHCVSVGESISCKKFLKLLKEKYKNSYVIVSSTTTTGHNEAKKSLSIADIHIYMPFDFSFIQSYYLKKIKPKIVIFVETDFWYNFLKYAKKYNSKIYLISAKMSKKSAKRYAKLSMCSKKLFSYFDFILCQNKTYFNRFLYAKAKKDKLKITGNIKFDNFKELLNTDEKLSLIKKLKLQDNKVLTIASTHSPEEEMILDKTEDLYSKINNLKIILAPRHINRIKEIEDLLNQKKVSFIKLSEIEKQNNEKIILVDSIGILTNLYQVSDLAIVCGSFIKRVGGHNVLEPIFLNTYTFFGPYMHTQEDLKKMALKYNLASQVNIENLNEKILNFFNDFSFNKKFETNVNILKNDLSKVSEKTLFYI
jgi:3-deoxy-D-manno-octulosonic-acid transferase